ncbi:MAG TPA: class I SAM-dependent methyltransferase [Phycisphaerae bacterium]|nr:class I SAM-dependent methyltransferase [Phycisphaerae bacterium]HRR85430.1 class I SAM-dependent methyltransferase [Phycisphaerae bacterium]
MRTVLRPDNPFGPGRHGFAWEHVPSGRRCHLDFGCGSGRFLETLRDKGFQRLIGIDASREAIEAGRRERPGLELIHRREPLPLPFADREIDSISLLDVLEHVVNQKGLLAELHRVLKDDGVLIVTVPGLHVFSCLDLGNLKFRFPRLHRWFYRLRHSQEDYEHRYAANPDGLIGDISAEKRWHEHFSREDLAGLLSGAGFEVSLFDGSGFFMRLLAPFHHLTRPVGPVNRMFQKLQRGDHLRYESANLFCVARKRPVTG